MVTRRQTSAAVIASLILGTIGVAALFFGECQKPTSNLAWSVEIGEEFIYEIQTKGIYSESNFDLSLGIALFSAMNNTRIRMVITSLPDLPSMIDGDTFAAEVINQPKTHCVFENGSELPTSYDDINNLLSSTILPTGDWFLLDWCLENEIDKAFFPGVYVSELREDHFFLGWELWPGDALFKWSANVTLETGVPFIAIDDKNSYSTGVHTIVTITLIS